MATQATFQAEVARNEALQAQALSAPPFSSETAPQRNAAKKCITISAIAAGAIVLFTAERVVNYIRNKRIDPNHDANLHGLKLSTILFLAAMLLLVGLVIIGFAIDSRNASEHQSAALSHLSAAFACSTRMIAAPLISSGCAANVDNALQHQQGQYQQYPYQYRYQNQHQPLLQEHQLSQPVVISA